jgi:1,2-diacylglycerol 3-alpha-glucosyltransferase
VTVQRERPAQVLLLCPGLEHAHRGFESFARDCFDALHGYDGLDLQLVKGSGPSGPGERAIPTLRRDAAVARLLGRAARRPPFVAEQLAFCASLIPLLLVRRPDVLYFSEWHVGRALAKWRSLARQRYKLVLCNGTLSAGPYDHLDLVQQLTPAALEWVLERGADPARNLALPLGFSISRDYQPLSADHRQALRERLGLPGGKRIVVSVAALNRHHKRLDYLIEEVASMRDPRPFLLLLGQAEQETPELRTLAEARLGPNGYSMRTVPGREVEDLTRASDVFVLASVWEGLPRALVEAMARGLPCIAHDYPISHYVLGEHGLTGDLSRAGVLAELIAGVDERQLGEEAAARRHRFVYRRFSWDVLRPRYADLLTGGDRVQRQT